MSENHRPGPWSSERTRCSMVSESRRTPRPAWFRMRGSQQEQEAAEGDVARKSLTASSLQAAMQCRALAKRMIAMGPMS